MQEYSEALGIQIACEPKNFTFGAAAIPEIAPDGECGLLTEPGQ
jgi:hypothetical protein